jgi:hypothetical protein
MIGYGYEEEWENAIRRNYRYFTNNIADPLDVVEYLYGETDPPLLTHNQKDEIQVEKYFCIVIVVTQYVFCTLPECQL